MNLLSYIKKENKRDAHLRRNDALITDWKEKYIHMQADIATYSYAAADWVERFLDSRVLRRAIWIVLALAVVYFSPFIFVIFTR